MNWTLERYTPLGVFDSPRVFYSTTPNPIMGSPEAVVDAGGRTNSLTVHLVQDMWPVTPRQIIRLSADGAGDMARGVVVTCPPSDSPGSGPDDADGDALDRVTCVGLEHLLTERIVGPLLVETATDVATIAYDFCSEYAHPAITVDVTQFTATSHSLNLYYKPEATLAEVLDELADTVPGGAAWRVSAQTGKLIFGPL